MSFDSDAAYETDDQDRSIVNTIEQDDEIELRFERNNNDTSCDEVDEGDATPPREDRNAAYYSMQFDEEDSQNFASHLDPVIIKRGTQRVTRSQRTALEPFRTALDDVLDDDDAGSRRADPAIVMKLFTEQEEQSQQVGGRLKKKKKISKLEEDKIYAKFIREQEVAIPLAKKKKKNALDFNNKLLAKRHMVSATPRATVPKLNADVVLGNTKEVQHKYDSESSEEETSCSIDDDDEDGLIIVMTSTHKDEEPKEECNKVEEESNKVEEEDDILQVSLLPSISQQLEPHTTAIVQEGDMISSDIAQPVSSSTSQITEEIVPPVISDSLQCVPALDEQVNQPNNEQSVSTTSLLDNKPDDEKVILLDTLISREKTLTQTDEVEKGEINPNNEEEKELNNVEEKSTVEKHPESEKKHSDEEEKVEIPLIDYDSEEECMPNKQEDDNNEEQVGSDENGEQVGSDDDEEEQVSDDEEEQMGSDDEEQMDHEEDNEEQLDDKEDNNEEQLDDKEDNEEGEQGEELEEEQGEKELPQLLSSIPAEPEEKELRKRSSIIAQKLAHRKKILQQIGKGRGLKFLQIAQQKSIEPIEIQDPFVTPVSATTKDPSNLFGGSQDSSSLGGREDMEDEDKLDDSEIQHLEQLEKRYRKSLKYRQKKENIDPFTRESTLSSSSLLLGKSLSLSNSQNSFELLDEEKPPMNPPSGKKRIRGSLLASDAAREMASKFAQFNNKKRKTEEVSRTFGTGDLFRKCEPQAKRTKKTKKTKTTNL